MTRKQKLIRQLEIAVFCLIGSAGSYYCQSEHFCVCGHLQHGSHEVAKAWVVDSIGLFGIIAAGVIGLQGGFKLSRVTGILCLIMVVLMFIPPIAPIGILATFPLLIVGIFHFVRALYDWDKSENVAEQVAASDR